MEKKEERKREVRKEREGAREEGELQKFMVKVWTYFCFLKLSIPTYNSSKFYFPLRCEVKVGSNEIFFLVANAKSQCP